MRYYRPAGVLAGFHADGPEADCPELLHIGEQWTPSHLSIPWHTHTVWEFYLQLDGASRWASRRRSWMLRPGGFFAAPPGREHHLVDHPAVKQHFFFAGIDLLPVLARYPELQPAWAGGECICLPHGQSLESPFRQLIREVSVRLPHRARAMRTALDYLVIEATRCLENARQKSMIPLNSAVAAAKNILEHQCQEPWRLADLGRLVGLSPNHLAVLFAREVGMSPHRFLLQQRIRRARELLRDSDISIGQMALDLGFSSSQHFAKAFGQLVRCSASQFRSRYR